MRSRRSPLFMFFLIGVFAVFVIAIRETTFMAYARQGVFAVLSPFFSAARSAQLSLFGMAGGDARTLQEENERLKSVQFAVDVLLQENAELRRALDMKEEMGVRLIGARVILYYREGGREYLMVERTDEKLIHEGMLVVTAERVIVGMIRTVSGHSAVVELASNPGETYAVIEEPARFDAVAKGLGARAFALQLVPASAPVRRGDLVGVVVPGSPDEGSPRRTFLLGEVVDEIASPGVAFKEVRATLIARPEFLERVFVISP